MSTDRRHRRRSGFSWWMLGGLHLVDVGLLQWVV